MGASARSIAWASTLRIYASLGRVSFRAFLFQTLIRFKCKIRESFNKLGLVSLFYGISNFVVYLMPNPCRKTGNKKVHIFFKSIDPKENVVARLEFELAYFLTTVQHFRYCAIETPLINHRNLTIYLSIYLSTSEGQFINKEDLSIYEGHSIYQPIYLCGSFNR